MKTGAEKAAKAVFGKVLAEVKPTKEELEESVYSINQITSALKKVVAKDVEIRVVGSVVRGTHLRGESDIDVFLLFPKKYKRDRITKEGLEYAKRIVKEKGDTYEVKYAEHPYTRLYLSSLGVKADIVPAFNIDNIEDMSTAVDRSPMHADFINKHLSEKQRDEVRLLKYLLKRQNLYGAEIMTSGFSGYLCELLIYRYGTLSDLLENAANFTLPILLDPKSKAELHDKSLVKRFNSQFIVIDPVDKDRNVAAGVSLETLGRFVMMSRAFMAKPRVDFFRGRSFKHGAVQRQLESFIRESGLDMYAIATKVPDKSEDIIWPQLRKVTEFIAAYAEKLGFRIYSSIPIILGRDGYLLFFAPKETLKTRMQKGPSVFIRKAQEAFSKAHTGAVAMSMRGDAIYALEKNRYADMEHLMRDVAAGRVLGKRKDITLRGSKLFINKLPKECDETVYADILESFRMGSGG
ncbi:MAG: CCA tRNA nucleotidyltransferase [Candidatus Micrarchaeota archaeon]|nr:CCA tRNA nucleotidyltransferase [Candidatus Micrarchaeota archaeon]